MKKILLLLFGIILMSNLLWSQEITNVAASQRTDGSKLLDVVYDLSGTEPEYTVILEISFDDGVNYQQVNMVSGDVGTVAPTTDLQIVWDAGTEFPDGFYSDAMKVKVTAEAAAAWQCGDVFIDSRDGQEYTTVQIGEQCWIAENLNIGTRIDGSNNQTNNGTIEKYCYDDNTSNCDTYGGLYQWNEMMGYTTAEGVQGICPENWHLPTDTEWILLTDFVVSQGYPNSFSNPNGAGNALKSCRQQNSPLGGDCLTDEHPRWNSHTTHSGFDAFGFGSLPGGHYNSGSYDYLGSYGSWCSCTQTSSTYAWYRPMYYNYGNVGRSSNNKSYGFSVRCLRD